MTARELILFLVEQTTRYFSPVTVAAEWVIVSLAALAIVSIVTGRSEWTRKLRVIFHCVAARRRTAIIICGLLPAGLRLSMLGLVPVPDPSIHDEFSHLLLADTLAHRRLTNPTHPMWVHFESIHIIQQPTYNSMYFPAQGSFLALGQVLFHEPWAGVVLSGCLMFAAMCWMMQGWLPPAWALYGTVIAIIKFGVAGLWMNSYLSGAVPGIGGALLIGSLPRLRRRVRAREGVLFGLAIVILMNSRPFEGALLTAAALLYLMPAMFRGLALTRRQRMTRVLVPAGIIVSAGLLFAMYYCYRVTGSPVRMPYQVNRDTYGWPENLAFLPAKNLALRHKVLQSMYLLELRNRDAYSSFGNVVASVNLRWFNNWIFFIGPLLTIPLVGLAWAFRDRRIRPLFLFFGVVVALNLFQLVLYPYHLGPIVAVIFAIVAQAIRRLYVMLKRANPSRALCLVIVLPMSVVLIGLLKLCAAEWDLPMSYWEVATEAHRDARAYLEGWLSARPRKQLVLVRYGNGHSPNQEWVYNRADIDASKVVWAREMDAGSNARLVQYFSDREAWLLQADVTPQRVVRFPGPPIVATPAIVDSTTSAAIP